MVRLCGMVVCLRGARPVYPMRDADLCRSEPQSSLSCVAIPVLYGGAIVGDLVSTALCSPSSCDLAGAPRTCDEVPPSNAMSQLEGRSRSDARRRPPRRRLGSRSGRQVGQTPGDGVEQLSSRHYPKLVWFTRQTS